MLRLKGTQHMEDMQRVVHLDLVGTGKARVYLGAYSDADAGFHGSLGASQKLLTWLEKAAARVRESLENEKREKQRRVRRG